MDAASPSRPPVAGVDIGGSGIKAALVDVTAGRQVTERVKLPTPRPADPAGVAAVVCDVLAQLPWAGPVGAALPSVVTSGVARTAANIDPTWIGVDVETLLGSALGTRVVAVNDADAAGLAEAAYGAARGQPGLVVVTTFGTGIGTALLHDGVLIPNSELGHLEVDGHDAELAASAAARKRDELTWQEWAGRLQRYFEALERYLWPDLFVIGGGVSRRADRFLHLLRLRTPIVPATLRNEAGIIGAAHLAASRAGHDPGRPGEG